MTKCRGSRVREEEHEDLPRLLRKEGRRREEERRDRGAQGTPRLEQQREMAQTLAKIKDGGAHSGGDQKGKELGVRRCGGHLVCGLL